MAPIKKEKISITGREIMSRKAGYTRPSFRTGAHEPAKYKRKTRNKSKERNWRNEY